MSSKPKASRRREPRSTAGNYLAWEPAQLDRHEYLDGDVFAVAGAEDRHGAAAKSCVYPDVLVTCSALDLFSALVKTGSTLAIKMPSCLVA